MLDGSIASFGDYDECLAIQSPAKSIAGKYCVLKLKAQKYLNVQEIDLELEKSFNAFEVFAVNIAVCFPSSCMTEEIDTIVKKSELIYRSSSRTKQNDFFRTRESIRKVGRELDTKM